MFCKLYKLLFYLLRDTKYLFFLAEQINLIPLYYAIMYIRKTSWEQDQIKDKYDPKSEHYQRERKRQRSYGVWGAF